MTNNMDDFDQDQFDVEPENGAGKKDAKQSLKEAWQNKPMFKLLVIMGFVGLMIAAALGAFSGSPAIEAAQIAHAPELKEPPGSVASPFFIEQNKQANEQRADQAMQQGGSSIPTPVGQNIDLADLTDKNRKDPLMEFRAETERLKQELRTEQAQNAQQLQALQQQVVQQQQIQQAMPQQQEDDTLAQAMQRQMQQLMEGWSPRNMKLVAGTATGTAATGSSSKVVRAAAQAKAIEFDQASVLKAEAKEEAKALVPAGTVNYAQLLTEANSDVPGPILAQILSGPLAGGRAIGRFQVMNDYIVLTFNLVTLKGKEYAINALALDPDTTLGAMATEVDHRYFSRVLLPAAGSFMSSFGSALSSGDTTTSQTDSGFVVNEAKKGYKEATFAGLGQAGQTIAQFFQQQAQQTKTLVRVGVGTSMGLFFLGSVFDPSVVKPANPMLGTLPGAMAYGYQQGGYQGVPGYALPGAGAIGAAPGGGLDAQTLSLLQGGANPYSSLLGAGQTTGTTMGTNTGGANIISGRGTTLYPGR